jgi:thermitase
MLLPRHAAAAPFAVPPAAQACQFTLGFATLRGLVGSEVVGECLENELHDAASGDAVQMTTSGLLVWRKLDNWTAFTDGQHTWLNGPNGVEERTNAERFAWEGDVSPLTLAPPPQVVVVSPPPVRPTTTGAAPEPFDAPRTFAVQPPAGQVKPAARGQNTAAPTAAAARTSNPLPPPAAATPTVQGLARSAVPTAAQEIYPLAASPVEISRGGRTVEVHPLITTRTPDGREAVADRLIVAFKAGTSPLEIATTHTTAQVLGAKAAPVRSLGSGIQLIDVSGMAPAAQVLAAYRSSPLVRYAEPDYVNHLDEVPNDPLFGLQWGMTQIQAPTAWNVTHGSTARFVAILDSGIYDEASTFPSPDGGPGHPDLRGKVALRVNFSQESDTDDNVGHGTHVAGIAAASTNNSIGVAGAGYLTRLLNVKVGGTGGAPNSAVLAGVRWAADNGANVINLSLGSIGECSAATQDAMDYAWARNVVIVVAAGNDGTSNPQSLASCQHVIAVASTDSSDTKSSFSNFGNFVHVAAPGGTDGSGHGIASTAFDGTYVYMSGTSMSAPHVAGVAALVWATSFGTSNQSVVDRLFETADHIAGTGSSWLYGRINAFQAVSQPACAPRPGVSVSVTPLAGRLQVTITVSAFDVFLRSLQFGNPSSNPSQPSNALIDVGSQTNQTGGFTYAPLLGTRQVTFLVRHAAAGPTTVPLVITDSCGQWPTFVGGGAGAF